MTRGGGASSERPWRSVAEGAAAMEEQACVTCSKPESQPFWGIQSEADPARHVQPDAVRWNTFAVRRSSFDAAKVSLRVSRPRSLRVGSRWLCPTPLIASVSWVPSGLPYAPNVEQLPVLCTCLLSVCANGRGRMIRPCVIVIQGQQLRTDSIISSLH